ncbi:MAG: glycoside hydrolase family 36 protein [Lentisphaeria bacterium]
MEIYSSYVINDMTLIYFKKENVYDFCIVPTGMRSQIADHRQTCSDTTAAKSLCKTLDFDFFTDVAESMVQFKRSDSVYTAFHSPGGSLRNNPDVKELEFVSQKNTGNAIETKFITPDKLSFTHVVAYDKNKPYVEVSTEIENCGEKPVSLDSFASFSLGMLSPFQAGEGCEKYNIYRFLSNWSAEGRSRCDALEDLGLEMSWQAAAVRSIRFGQKTTMPVKNYFPFVGFEDCEYGVVWGAQLAAYSAWQLEVSRFCDYVNLSGGIPDFDFGSWQKKLAVGERYAGPTAVLSCLRGNIQQLMGRLTVYQENDNTAPASETKVPALFNEFCKTWGNPTEEVLKLVKSRLAQEKCDIQYFVLDAGWFRDCLEKEKQTGNIGDWDLCETNYPGGFDAFLDSIRKAGYVPGIWFELEIAVTESKIYKEHPDWLLTSGGSIIQVGNRSFLDFRKQDVVRYLQKKVIAFLRKHRIGYLKTDYNACVPIGCDGPDSPAENLRQYTAAVVNFYRLLKSELPDLVLEICASGGHRLSPGWLKLGHMASSTDAHEGVEIPIIAANVQQLIPISKSQMWSTLRPDDTSKRLHYSLTAAMIGRLCLSGDIDQLDSAQMEIVKKGLLFYDKMKFLLVSGKSHFERSLGKSYTSPKGWQIFTRESNKGKLIIIHTFLNSPYELVLPACRKPDKVFAPDFIVLENVSEGLRVYGLENFTGLALFWNSASISLTDGE